MKEITYSDQSNRPDFGINMADIDLFFNKGHNGDLLGIK